MTGRADGSHSLTNTSIGSSGTDSALVRGCSIWAVDRGSTQAVLLAEATNAWESISRQLRLTMPVRRAASDGLAVTYQLGDIRQTEFGGPFEPGHDGLRRTQRLPPHRSRENPGEGVCGPERGRNAARRAPIPLRKSNARANRRRGGNRPKPASSRNRPISGSRRTSGTTTFRPPRPDT